VITRTVTFLLPLDSRPSWRRLDRIWISAVDARRRFRNQSGSLGDGGGPARQDRRPRRADHRRGDDDLRGQITATSNRLRGLLTQIHPALERVLGKHLDHPAVLDLIQTWRTPADLPCMGKRLAEDITAALAE
jgi:hypothetical protein